VWTFKLRQGSSGTTCRRSTARVRRRRRQVLLRGVREGGRAVLHFQEVEGIETPDKHTVRVHLKTPNVLFPQNVAEPITVMFSREVLEEDGDLKKRMIGTGPFILKEHNRKVRVVLTRSPDYWDKGRPTWMST